MISDRNWLIAEYSQYVQHLGKLSDSDNSSSEKQTNSENTDEAEYIHQLDGNITLSSNYDYAADSNFPLDFY